MYIKRGHLLLLDHTAADLLTRIIKTGWSHCFVYYKFIYLLFFFLIFISWLRTTKPCTNILRNEYLKSYFPSETHYKNLEELVPKHPPDSIIVHQHFFLHFPCSASLLCGKSKMCRFMAFLWLMSWFVMKRHKWKNTFLPLEVSYKLSYAV